MIRRSNLMTSDARAWETGRTYSGANDALEWTRQHPDEIRMFCGAEADHPVDPLERVRTKKPAFIQEARGSEFEFHECRRAPSSWS